MLRLARIIGWICLLEALWAMVVGTTQSTELVAGLIAASVAALFAEVLDHLGLMRFALSSGAVRSAWSIPGHVVFDWGLVLWIVVRDAARGRRVRGAWLEVPSDEEEGPSGRFRRALTVALENGSSNGIVVDLDHGRALLHSLDTGVSTGRQVM